MRKIFLRPPFLQSLFIVHSLITSSTNGYDGSMMNAVQSLDAWEDYFHTPKDGKLGLLNAIQVSFISETI